MHWSLLDWHYMGAIVMMVFWVAALAFFVWFIHSMFTRNLMTHYRPSGEPSPLEIVKRRYAKGEIDKEEFERMKNDLLE